MCILLNLHNAKYDASGLFCSKVIEEKPLGGVEQATLGKGRVKIVHFIAVQKKNQTLLLIGFFKIDQSQRGSMINPHRKLILCNQFSPWLMPLLFGTLTTQNFINHLVLVTFCKVCMQMLESQLLK